MSTMMVFVDSHSSKPIYLQIADHVTALARNGQLRPGDSLPPTRSLADQLQVHRSTVINAYDELKARGVIQTRPGSGSFVAEGVTDPSVVRPAALTPPPAQPEAVVEELWRLSRVEGVTSLALSQPGDEMMPVDFDRARQRVLRRDGPKAMGYEDPQGYYPLRQAVAADLARHGILAEASDIVITWGAQGGVSLAARALARAGDYVLTEAPTFFSTLFSLGHLGLNLLPFALTDSGPDWSSLQQQLQSAPSRPRFVHVIADHQNPTGLRWSMPHRHEFLKFRALHDLLVIDDATYIDLTFDGAPHLPLRALDPDVIHVGSFSKSFVPGLRIGFVLANEPVRQRLTTLQVTSSSSGEALGQRSLAEYLTSGAYVDHLARINAIYRARRDAMLQALADFLPPEARWQPPTGGLHVWIKLPPNVSAEALFRNALQHGIVVAPASIFFPAPAAVNAFRLSYSRCSEDSIVRAVRTLGKILTTMVGRSL